MARTRESRFVGLAGRLTWGAFGPWSVGDGLLLGLVVGGLVYMSEPQSRNGVVAVALHLVGAIAAARAAGAGANGETEGWMLSSACGSWGTTIGIAVRYLLLTAVVWAPWWLMTRMPSEPGDLGELAGAPGMELGNLGPMGLMLGLMRPAVMLTGATAMLLSVFSPPILLIVAVSAESVVDLVRPAHWRELFGGRLGDLFVIYSSYLGALGMTLLIAMPIGMIAVAIQPRAGLLVGGLSMVFAVGLAVGLGGRLCGAFVASAPGGLLAEPPVVTLQGGPQPGRQPASQAASQFGGPNASRGTSGAPGMSTGSTLGVGPTIAATPAGKRALVSSAEKVAEARALWATDRAGAIAMLGRLDEQYQPSPQVLQALGLMLLEAGETQRAEEIARRAIPLCLERGHLLPAAELFQRIGARVPALQLEPDTLIGVGNVLLQQHHDQRGAANAFALVIHADPHNVRAIKAMLTAADQLAHARQEADAARLYEFLLERCADSPLADFMREGLARARRQGATV